MKPTINYGTETTYYTGSTTGQSVNNDDSCSRYTPVTWQVDRKCHLISASSFDKLCAEMVAQADDMADDLFPHGSRPLVAENLAASNHQNMRFRCD
jgi:Delta carbonic anhydrase